MPHWFKEAVVYHILIDRFAGSYLDASKEERPEFCGGTLSGILNKLDYLQDLGVNTLWISPFYQTNAYHGYAITDFFKVDPRFGTLDDLKTLIAETHRREMRIIADFVPNHCSSEHPFFLEAKEDKKSEYRRWFFFRGKHYKTFLSVKELPKLNLDHAPCREHILEAARFWLGLGLDGFRLDHVIGPSHAFWKAFRKEVKEEHPECVLIGEAWMKGIKRTELCTLGVKGRLWKWMLGSSSVDLFRSYVGELDGCLDFRAQEKLAECGQGKDITSWARKHFSRFPGEFFVPTFLDNHDMDRFLFTCGGDKEKLKRAAKIQFGLPAPPIIYYGTEMGMTQEKSLKEFPSHGDLQARRCVRWHEMDHSLVEFYKGLIRERKQNSPEIFS